MNATLPKSSHYLPTPEEIRKATQEIRRNWTPSERRLRRQVASYQQQRLLGSLLRSAA